MRKPLLMITLASLCILSLVACQKENKSNTTASNMLNTKPQLAEVTNMNPSAGGPGGPVPQPDTNPYPTPAPVPESTQSTTSAAAGAATTTQPVPTTPSTMSRTSPTPVAPTHAPVTAPAVVQPAPNNTTPSGDSAQ